MFEMLAQENLQTDETVEDAFATESLFKATGALESSFKELDELNLLSTTLEDLEHLHVVAAEHGMTPSLMAFTNRDLLLTSAIPALSGCEAFPVSAPEAIAAQEALMSTIGEVTAAWFKKAWDAVVGFGDKITKYAKAAATKVGDAAAYIRNKTYDAAKATKEKFKAHPIKTTLIAIAAIAAIAAVITVIWGMALPASSAAAIPWVKSINNHILNAVGKYGFKVNGLYITYPPGFGVTEVETALALGYSGPASTALVTTATATVNEGSAFARLGAMIAANAQKLLTAAKAVGGDALVHARKALNMLMMVSRELIKFVTGTAMTVVSLGLTVVKTLFGENKNPGTSVVPA